MQQAVELYLLYPDGLIRLSAANMADAVCTGGYCDPGDHAVWEPSYSALSAYRLEFQGLTAWQTSVVFEDWGRMPITGRQAGTYSAIVKRNGQTILSESLTF